MMRPPEYRPIPCERYSELELCIMHGRPLRIRWRRAGLDYVARVTPLDLRTRRGAEYLILLDPGGRRQWWRLDRMLEFEPLAASA
ncbi:MULTISPECIES: transcriptional antiterminator, Rof [unclassified Thioalkalivibrio]|uniref:WYL domain-containing protein n=2 Tax=unclassified Thioalkalivibrio TaxID=2621013 RepID=UPI000DA12A32|nr:MULTISPECIES: transcriptional antiterminator, Rof [unclassified Thioalkalivibrio]